MAVLSELLCAAAPSPTSKLRRTLLEEGGGAFLLVFGGGANAEEGGFQHKAFALARLHPLVCRLKREADGDGSVGGNFPKDGLGVVFLSGF